MNGPSRTVGGRYRLLERLGAGAMGTVWRAEDLTLGRHVAVKEVVFPPGIDAEEAENLRERTRREARSAARLDHPSAVTVYDVVEEDGRPWLVMELVEARTLAEVIREDGPLPPARTAQIGLAVLGALVAAHAQGIVHRDVKPGNVLIRPPERGSGRVVLTDFGIATTVGDASLTSTGLLLGSPAYISPERARGHAPGPESDLWSLGATLFTAVEGRPPYDGQDAVATVTSVVNGHHAPYAAAGPLTRVLDGLLEKDPLRRLDAAGARALLLPLARAGHLSHAPARPAEATTSEHTTAFDVVEGGAPTSLRPPRVVRPAPAASPRRSRRALVAAAAVVLALVAGGLTVVLLQDDDSGSAAASTSAPPPPAVTPGSTERPAGVPADWQLHQDPAGWSIWVPPSFQQSTNRDAVQLRDETTRSTLRIRAVPGAASGPAIVTARESGFQTLGSYARVSLAPGNVPGLGATGDLEFTFVDQVPLRVLDRGMVVDGVGYELYWQTPATSWAGARALADQIAATFRAPVRR